MKTTTVKKAGGHVQPVQDSRRIKFVASHEKPDRDGQVIALTGLDTTNYMRNPILLVQHDWTSRAVGKVESLHIAKIDGYPALVGTATFPNRPASDDVLADIRAGLLNSVSVGLLLHEQGRPIMQGQSGSTIVRSELIEISLVSVPACASCNILEKEHIMKRSCECDELEIDDELAAQIPSMIDAAVTQALHGHSVAKRNEIDTSDHDVQRILKDLPRIVREAFYEAVRQEVRTAMRGLQGKVD